MSLSLLHRAGAYGRVNEYLSRDGCVDAAASLVVIMTNVFCDDLDPRLSWDREYETRAMRSPDSMEPKSVAQSTKGENWSPVWIFPIVAYYRSPILFYHYSHRGPEALNYHHGRH